MLKEVTQHLRFLQRSFFVLLAAILVVFSLGGVFAVVISAKMEESSFSSVSLAIAVDPDDTLGQTLLSYAVSSSNLGENISIQVVQSRTQANEMLSSGEVTAVLLIPSDFYGWINGDKTEQPVLVLGTRSGVEYGIFSTIGASLMSILSSAQYGVALTSQALVMLPNSVNYYTAWLEINVVYLSMALDQSARFQDVVVTGPDAVPYLCHYVLCICFCLLLLATPLLHGVLSLSRRSQWLRRLRAMGMSAGRYAACQLAAATVVYGILLLLLSACIAILLRAMGQAVALSPLVLPVALVLGFFLAGFTFFFANLGAASGIATCLVGLGSLVLAGGLVPTILLPGILSRLEGASPVYWMRGLLSGVFWGRGSGFAGYFLLTLCVGAALWGLSLLQCRRFERRMA